MKASSLIPDLMSFLDRSPTAWHAVTDCVEQLTKYGFNVLSEQDNWTLQPSTCYVVTRNGSALCAFVTPKQFPKRVRLLASHTDSPGFKLKPNPEIRKYQMLLWGVEIYGAPLLSSWLNRDLGVAGRIFYTASNQALKTRLVRLDRYSVTIPQLAIHLDREVNEKGLQLNKQEHLNALVGLVQSSTPPSSSFLEKFLQEEEPFDHLISHDLFLFPLEKARLMGDQEVFLAAYRIDSLASVHAALKALLTDLEPLEEDIKMMMIWDNEEVGSQTKQGALSPFGQQILERICLTLGGTRQDYFCLLNRSLCLSIDLAHALHPNYMEKHDPQHAPIMGKGIIVKSNAQQRYATDAHSMAFIQWLAKHIPIPLQKFVSRNDTPCGTTIGPLQATATGMTTVDIGCGQLSMHSCRELMACQDHLDMYHLLAEFLKNKDLPSKEEKVFNKL